jgi:hypothetical protein
MRHLTLITLTLIIETYTWGVLPDGLRRPVEEQIAGEYAWVLSQ